MKGIILNSIFLLFTIYVLIKTISYGLYEYRNENNKYGGVCIIIFSLLCVLYSNIMIWLN